MSIYEQHSNIGVTRSWTRDIDPSESQSGPHPAGGRIGIRLCLPEIQLMQRTNPWSFPNISLNICLAIFALTDCRYCQSWYIDTSLHLHCPAVYLRTIWIAYDVQTVKNTIFFAKRQLMPGSRIHHPDLPTPVVRLRAVWIPGRRLDMSSQVQSLATPSIGQMLPVVPNPISKCFCFQ